MDDGVMKREGKGSGEGHHRHGKQQYAINESIRSRRTRVYYRIRCIDYFGRDAVITVAGGVVVAVTMDCIIDVDGH